MTARMQIFKAMLWKNYVIRKRHYILTLLEILFPCLVIGLILFVKLKLNDGQGQGSREKKIIPATIYEKDYLSHYCYGMNYDSVIVYSPNNSSVVNNIIQKVRGKISHGYYIGFKPNYLPMEDENAIIKYYNSLSKNTTQEKFVALVFDVSDPLKLQYKIRINYNGFQTENLFMDIAVEALMSSTNYIASCYLVFQKTIDEAYTELISRSPSNINVSVCEYPMPSYDANVNMFNIYLELFLPFVIIISYSLNIPNVCKKIVEEKQIGAKELMKMMGVQGWMVWFGWLLNTNMVNIVVSTIMTVILTGSFGGVAPLMPLANPLIIWILLVLAINAAYLLVFVVCAFFSNALVAYSIAMLFYAWPLIVHQLSIVKPYLDNYAVKLVFCLSPSVAVTEAMKIIFAFNSRGVGSQFNNLFSSPTETAGDLTLGIILMMFILDVFLYGVLTWYIDSVRPGQYGIAKPWYFIFTMWRKKDEKAHLLLAREDDEPENSNFFENQPKNLPIGISIRNLKKFYPPNVYAVNGVNLDLYKGQITALLGHNGAGKTTTMSMLTGLFSPTEGEALHYQSKDSFINIFENMDFFRKDLGLCPQHNIIFSYFTVIEHLIFFGMLKGSSMREARREGLKLLNLMNLVEKKNKKGSELSGGMQRKLSLAISLVGSPKVLMLDEPTTGIDAESRRAIWDVLLNLREQRTIIISTHFMEEADVLGDQIAIMGYGKVKCCGSTMFLKKAYGAGYNMTLLVETNADIGRITDIVTSKVPGSTLKSNHPGQLVYNLPSESMQSFVGLFMEIENRKNELMVTSIGVACTTMEDVFLKVGEQCNLERKLEEDKESQISKDSQGSVSSSTQLNQAKRLSGLPLYIRQFQLLLHKKMLYFYRKKWSLVFFYFLSIAMMLLTVRNFLVESDSLKNLTIKEDLYKNTIVPVTYSDKLKSYETIYSSIISNSKVESLKDGNLTKELLDVGKKNIVKYRYKYVYASEWMNNSVTAYYSSIALHSAPVSLNLVTNTILKSVNKSLSIVAQNHPFGIIDTCSGPGMNLGKIKAVVLWVASMPNALTFLVASFISFPILERINSAKHVQLMTGLPPFIYWTSTFIWDFFNYLACTVIMYLAIFIFDNSGGLLSKPTEFGVFVLLVTMYGVSGLAFVYFFSYFKNREEGASSNLVFFCIIFGLLGGVAITIFNALEVLQVVSIILDHILLFMPFYCLVICTRRFITIAFTRLICSKCNIDEYNTKVCDDAKYDYLALDDHGFGKYLLMMLFDFFFYFILILLIDHGIIAELWKQIKTFYLMYFFPDKGEYSLDKDVKDEVDRVVAVENDQDASTLMVVKGLKKIYGRKFAAVKGISFAVNSGECFGLLGVNGAGKTTTFKMLTGDVMPTAGTAAINRYNLMRNRSEFMQQIGYCPQFDAINELMTGREMINLFAQLRGIREHEAQKLTDYWLDFLGLTEYADRLCGTYSGGNKRKLSTALALIGDPIVVFLDEPTSGVDPVARRKLWNVLARSQRARQSIVLTSHSMDECEALCDRLTIMVNGQMACIGNIQYLKQTFAQGYTIMIKLRAIENTEDAVKYLQFAVNEKFKPNCILKDQHMGLLHYHITDKGVLWSTLFNTMNEIKQSHPIIEDYTVSETTLEQVFISFAKNNNQKLD